MRMINLFLHGKKGVKNHFLRRQEMVELVAADSRRERGTGTAQRVARAATAAVGDLGE